MKKLLKRTGLEGKQTVFLFTDTQIVHETFLEVSALLLHPPCNHRPLLETSLQLAARPLTCLLTQAAAVQHDPDCCLGSGQLQLGAKIKLARKHAGECISCHMSSGAASPWPGSSCNELDFGYAESDRGRESI